MSIDSISIVLNEHAALAVREAAKRQIRRLNRRPPNPNGPDLNVRDVEHLKFFIAQVETKYPPLSQEERELVRELRLGRVAIQDANPSALEGLIERNRLVWYETQSITKANTSWPAPNDAWLGLRE